ncbi:MAG: phosphoribosylanthranilate isomerase [Oscillospiraceae bacterium]|jgi:phosphoribosylanthranilate isomerase|nr:phosphoribosylanthranilate isomerase [Oscillospiraceae bacterium]
MAKLKICGIRRDEDVNYVNEARPDYVGFVFWPHSKRAVTPAQAARLRERLAPDIVPAGVFVNAKTADILALHRAGTINIAQLHGNESEADVCALQAAGVSVIRMMHAHALRPTIADYLLLDSGMGSGVPFDWSQLAHMALTKRWFLAGGISSENIAQALALRPYAVDVSSGAETNGVKDRAKILALAVATRKSPR